MPNKIVLDTNEGTVVKVDGQCFILNGATSSAVTHSSTTASYSTCNDCQSSSSSSSSSSGDVTPACAAATLSCASGTEPSIVVQIYDADYSGASINWCGKTWTQQQVKDGKCEEVCPTFYGKTSQYVELWQNKQGTNKHLQLQVTVSSTDAIRTWALIDLQATGTGTPLINAYARRVWDTPTAKTYTPTTWNPLTGMAAPSSGNYKIADDQFTSITVSGVKYSWKRGTNW